MTTSNPHKGPSYVPGVSFLGENTPYVLPRLKKRVLDELDRCLKLKSLDRFPFTLTSEALSLDPEAKETVRMFARKIKDLPSVKGFEWSSFMWGAGLGYSLAHMSYEETRSELEGLHLSLRRYREIVRRNIKSNSGFRAATYSSKGALHSTDPNKPLQPLDESESFLAKLLAQRQDELPND